VRENKNVTTLGYLSTLTALNRFRSTSMLLHRVGHSHGPLDQLFGVIATAMKYVDLLANNDDAVATFDWIMFWSLSHMNIMTAVTAKGILDLG
jgi:hypothetical protein